MRPWARWLGLGALYAAAAVLFTWPMPRHLGTHLWGDRFDAWTTLWLLWQLGDTLAAPAAHTERILYPLGYDLWSFGHLALQALAAPAIHLGLSPVVAYNLLALAALVFSALGAHALGETLAEGQEPRARLAAGLVAATVFTFNPYLYGELRAGCLELVAAGFLPLFLRAVIRLSARPSPRGVLGAAALLAVVGPFNWYYALFTGMLGLAFAAWMAVAGRARAALAVLAALGLGLGMVAPLIPLVQRETPTRMPISAEQFTPERWERSRALADGELPLAGITEADLLDLDALQVVLNSTTLSALLRLDFPTNPLESTPGRLAWCVGLIGLAAAGRRALPWIGLAGGFTVLTLGPYALVDQSPPLSPWSLDHPLPYAWLYNYAPLFSKAYRPYRIGVIVLTTLAAAGAAGVSRLGGPGSRLDPRALLGVGLSLLAVGASQPHWVEGRPAADALTDARVPEAYGRLAGRPGAIVELPLHYQPLSVATASSIAHQRLHRRPMLNCNQLIRRTELAAFQSYVGANTLLLALLDLARSQPPWRFLGQDASRLHQDGFRDLVVRTRLPAESRHLAGYQESADRLGLAALSMLEGAFGPPWLDEGGLLVFELRDLPPGEQVWDDRRITTLQVPFAELGLPVWLKEGQALRLGAGAGGLTRAGAWVLVEEGRVELRLEQGGRRSALALEADPAAPEWVWLRLDGGEGDWALELAGEGRARLARPEVERARPAPGG